MAANDTRPWPATHPASAGVASGLTLPPHQEPRRGVRNPQRRPPRIGHNAGMIAAGCAALKDSTRDAATGLEGGCRRAPCGGRCVFAMVIDAGTAGSSVAAQLRRRWGADRPVAQPDDCRRKLYHSVCHGYNSRGLFRRVSCRPRTPSVQTAYAELYEQVQVAEASRSPAFLTGKVGWKTIKGRRYGYGQFKEIDGRKREYYLGPEGPAVQAIERAREQGTPVLDAVSRHAVAAGPAGAFRAGPALNLRAVTIG